MAVRKTGVAGSRLNFDRPLLRRYYLPVRSLRFITDCSEGSLAVATKPVVKLVASFGSGNRRPSFHSVRSFYRRLRRIISGVKKFFCIFRFQSFVTNDLRKCYLRSEG